MRREVRENKPKATRIQRRRQMGCFHTNWYSMEREILKGGALGGARAFQEEEATWASVGRLESRCCHLGTVSAVWLLCVKCKDKPWKMMLTIPKSCQCQVHISGSRNVNTRLSKCGHEFPRTKLLAVLGRVRVDRDQRWTVQVGTLDQVSSSDHLTWWEGQQESEVMGRSLLSL